MSEYLYDKENPRSPLRNKPQGWESFYPGMPNHFERTEMITRRMLKDYDGDLSKLTLDVQKKNDFGYKWRLMKNYARFIKHPIGYTHWKMMYMFNQGRLPSLWNIFVYSCLLSIFLQLKNRSQEVQTNTKEYLRRNGAKNYQSDKGFSDERIVTVVDTTGMKKKSANLFQQFKNFHPALFTEAYWCRDQNFRKYLQTRKNHGIEPSVNYNNFAYKNIEKDYYKSIEEMKKMADSLKN